MEDEFIPYEQALALKELGFDGACIMAYYHMLSEDKKDRLFLRHNDNKTNSDNAISAPLFQQAFKWFRKKYKLHSRVFFDGLRYLEESDEERYDFDIVEQWTIGKDYFDYSYGFKHVHSSRGVYMSHEEAALECLKKLIEIVESLKK
jgi:hypothetical protein